MAERRCDAVESIVDKIRMDGKTAIVTGGHSGIGRGIVEALTQAGANIVIAGRREELGRKVCEEVSADNGVRALFVKTDVTKDEDRKNVVARTISEFGRIDALVNCSGIVHHENAEDVSYENWRRVMDVNLDGLFFMCQAVGREMIRQKGGNIVNISSNSDLLVMTPQTQVGYNAGKAGVDMVTKCLAYEWAKHNIRVNAIAPGYVQTDLLPAKKTPEGKLWADVWKDMIPLRRFGKAEEIGALALYLASDMSPFLTGSILLIDGGYSLT
jgi:NAD(P)-dependent dehydrogenase (short-subunit alcohol dehydrogenase family)